jgi:DNA adenine methylase
MAPWIIERLPDHTHFVEACAGSAAVMAIKPPVDAETVNDTYGEVVNFFRVIRKPGHRKRLIDMVAFTPYSHAEFLAAGELLGSSNDDPVTRAWAFMVRMQMAVVPGRTGWSYSVSGPSAKKANKPGRWATMPELIRITGERFERVWVTDWDILDLMDRMDKPGVLVFVDPPYIEESRPTSTGSSSGYEHDTFPHNEFILAAQEAKHMSVVVTHYPHPAYDSSFDTVDDYTSHRNVPNGPGRDKKIERLYQIIR